ncbi:MAG: tetratricopeptide repeat protein [Acidobacteria bacterium]|nr:tetratricopeptide repeat protein [Acidobacteriota bacterium]
MPKRTSTRAAASPTAKTATAGEAVTPTLAAAPVPPPHPGKIFRKASVLLPVALALLSSLNTLWNGFALDDSQQVLNNPFIRDLKNLPLAFTTSVWSFATTDIGATAQPYYRPLFSALFTLIYAVFGSGSAVGWHLVNILIHAAVTFLVYVVCKELTGRQRLSLIAASLFAVHPAHTESVAWISGVTDPLMSLLVLPAFYGYLRYRRSGNFYFLAVTLLGFLGALWSKETAIALPLVIAYCELIYFKEAAPFWQRLKRLLLIALLFAVPLAIYLFTRHQAFGAFVAGDDLRYPFSVAVLTIPLAILKYLWLSAIPVGYSYQHYTAFVTAPGSWQFLLSLVAVVALVVAIVRSPSRLLQFASLWFFAFLAPALLGIVTFDPSYLVQERYLYLPLMGFALLVASFIEWLAARQKNIEPQRLVTIISAVLVLLFGAVYVWYNTQWYDTVKVFQRVVAAAPDSAYSHAALSGVYASAGRPREAEQEARKALELDPQCIYAYANLSYFAKQKGKLDEAIAFLEQARATVPLTPITHTHIATILLNLGLLYAQRGELERAETTLQESNALWSRTIGYYYTGQFYYNQGRFAEALPYYETVLRRVPENYAPIRLTLANVYDKLNQTGPALAAYHQFLELAPANAPERDQVNRRLQQLQGTQPTK